MCKGSYWQKIIHTTRGSSPIIKPVSKKNGFFVYCTVLYCTRKKGTGDGRTLNFLNVKPRRKWEARPQTRARWQRQRRTLRHQQRIMRKSGRQLHAPYYSPCNCRPDFHMILCWWRNVRRSRRHRALVWGRASHFRRGLTLGKNSVRPSPGTQ